VKSCMSTAARTRAAGEEECDVAGPPSDRPFRHVLAELSLRCNPVRVGRS
jgi:hypothetical protein